VRKKKVLSAIGMFHKDWTREQQISRWLDYMVSNLTTRRKSARRSICAPNDLPRSLGSGMPLMLFRSAGGEGAGR
jgi:hypothetical protein